MKKWIPLSVYGGVGFMKQTFPKILAVGATSNTAAFNADLMSDWAVKAKHIGFENFGQVTQQHETGHAVCGSGNLKIDAKIKIHGPLLIFW
jgi:hypothetical protein